MDNQSTRLAMRKMREQLTADEVTAKSGQVIQTILNHLNLSSYDAYLCYMPFRNEVDLRPLYLQLLDLRKRLYFPVTGADEICFYEVSDLSEFHSGTFGILEPTSEILYEGNENTLSFTPGLAFSESGERIGYGGGYYDRFYEVHPDVTRLGVCFDAQISSEITVMDWDISMHMVATESGFYTNL